MSAETTTTRSYEFTEAEKHRTLRKVTFSSFLGNFIEWFDYASYSYLAGVIGIVFFPSADPVASFMSALAIFAVSFLLRPIGALFWGNIGDRKGRKWALTVSILCMSGATFLIGCLPSFASAGIIAPILLTLLRMAQSFSAAGEYAGAATFIAEYAPRKRRGLYCSMVPASTAAGLLIGSFLVTIMTIEWGSDSTFMLEWGWRFPFLLAAPLGLITHYIRKHVEDSPIYEKMQDDLQKRAPGTTSSPVLELLKRYPKKTLISFGACMLNAVGFYAVLTYLPNYLRETLQYDENLSLIITNIVLIAYIAFIFLSGFISDRFGRKRMLIGACVGFIIFTIPAFMLLGTKNFFVILAVELFLALLLTINDGTLSSYLNETFPTEVRFSGFAFSFNLANAIFGGSASYISAWLIQESGSPLAPGVYMVGIAIIALIAMIFSHEHSDQELDEVK